VKGIDTNVLVRYVMQDDERQSALATKLFEGLTIQEPGFIALVSLVEFSWVLSSCFDLKRDDIADAVEQICGPNSWSWKVQKRFGRPCEASALRRQTLLTASLSEPPRPQDAVSRSPLTAMPRAPQA